MSLVVIVAASAGCVIVAAGALDQRLARRFVGARILHSPGATTAPSGRRRRPPILHRLRRRQQPPASDLASLLDDIARRCSSGEAIRQAFESCVAGSAFAGEFEPALRAVRSGATLAEALQSSGDRPPDADLVLASHVLRLCAAQGGDISESLDRAAATLRERQAITLERLAQSSHARLSAQVLTLLPAVFGSWTCLTSAAVRQFVATPPGLATVIVGLALNLIGWRLMKRIIEGSS